MSGLSNPHLHAGVAAIAAALLIACSAGPRKSSAVREPPGADSAVTGAPPAEWELLRKEEIRTAWDRIGELRQDPKLGLSREPTTPMTALASASELRQCVEDAEEPTVTAECTDVCNIKDAICDNTEDICRIADELGDDVWAKDKCNSAKASCKEAKEICCGCIE